MDKRIELGVLGVLNLMEDAQADLECPVCQGENLHQGDVVALQRPVEDGPVHKTVAWSKGGSAAAVMPTGPGRRDGVLIYMFCENCHSTGDGLPESDERLALGIFQHKGATFMRWYRGNA